jgi:hypothetical protein
MMYCADLLLRIRRYIRTRNERACLKYFITENRDFVPSIDALGGRRNGRKP